MRELFAQFGIDWKLLIAQVVNFFLLLFLLKKFAYAPIMKMLARRRKDIEEGIRASSEAQKNLADSEEERRNILVQAHEQALAVVSAAEKDADAHSKNILESAHTKSEQVIASGQQRLEDERIKLVEDVHIQAEDLIKKSLIKVIGKLEPAERDRMLIQEALRELRSVSTTS